MHIDSLRARVALSTAALFCTSAGPAAAQTLEWARQFGTAEQEFPTDAVADGADGLFVVGLTNGDLGAGNKGPSDAVVARYDGAGNRLWLRQFGTSGSEGARAVAHDGAGGVFVTGETTGSFAGGNAGKDDAWLVRLGADGVPRWRAQFGTQEDDEPWAAAPDGAGGVFLAGRTGADLGGPFAGGITDGWVSRHDRSGNRMWIRQIGTDQQEFVHAVVSDGVGGVLVCGWTQGSLGGPSAGGTDAFVRHLDGGGQTLWTTQLGGSQSDSLLAGAADGSGGVYIGGYTDGGFGSGTGNAWIGRLDSSGATQWVRRYGDFSTQVIALAPARSGVFVTGSTLGSFGGAPQGQEDAWLGLFDAAGQPQWLHKIGSSTHEQPVAVAPGRKGGLLVTGHTQGMLAGPPLGKLDFWIARVAAP